MSMAKAAKLSDKDARDHGKFYTTVASPWSLIPPSSQARLPGSLLGTTVEVRDGFIVRSYLSNTVRALRAGQALDQSGTNSLS